MVISIVPYGCFYNGFRRSSADAKLFLREGLKPQSSGLVGEIAEIYREARRGQLGAHRTGHGQMLTAEGEG
jgi:hypothetical protein